jgi:hypothetical protein
LDEREAEAERQFKEATAKKLAKNWENEWYGITGCTS